MQVEVGILSHRIKQLVSEGPYLGAGVLRFNYPGAEGRGPEGTALVQKLRSIAGSQCHRLHDGNTNILPGLYQCMSIPSFNRCLLP